MKNLFIGIFIGVTIYACSGMGGKSSRLIDPVDESQIPWIPCTPKMIENYKGKFCVVKCEKKLKKDGSCKGDKYKYISKDFKNNHDFFMNKYILVLERYFY